MICRICSRMLFLMIVLILPTSAAAVWGIPDKVPAATLLVPFFEVGVDVAQNPHDTLPIVFNGSSSSVTVHWEVWNIDGEGTDGLFGNEVIPAEGSWSGSLRNLINLQATTSDRDRLRDGPDFYRGFMTIDVVSRSTISGPKFGDYPFAFDNVLNGMIYYARFLDGSSNALSMVPIEAVIQDDTIPNFDFFEGFYGDGIGFREEIDSNARTCANLSQIFGNCNFLLFDNDLDSIHARVARRDVDETDTRLIVFSWSNDAANPGGPSTVCANLGCAQFFSFRRTRQDGSAAISSAVRLDHVVNIIRPPEIFDDPFGDFRILNISDLAGSIQFYAFVMQSAKPPAFPSFNWDAIYEATIDP